MTNFQQAQSGFSLPHGVIPPVEPGTISIWCTMTPWDADQDPFLLQLLSPAEKERAQRIRIASARRDAVMARACLRLALGSALAIRPQQVRLRTNEHGKPLTDGIHFNLSHAHGMVVLALCHDAAVGIDVEWGERKVEVLDLAESVCTPHEIEQLRSLSVASAQLEAFFRCWTRKEAILKMLGTGLAGGASKIETSFSSDHEHAVSYGEKKCGFVRGLPLPGGYLGAIACEAPSLPLIMQNVLYLQG